MYRIIWLTLTLFFLTMFAASALSAGYRIEPWGSKTWTGSGRPPHWSAAPDPQPAKPARQFSPGSFGKPGDTTERRVRGVDGPRGGKDAFWKDKYNRRHHHHRSRVNGSISYQEPRVEEVIIERRILVPVYIQNQQPPARLQCGGKTITRTDQESGELIIEYVTGARDC